MNKTKLDFRVEQIANGYVVVDLNTAAKNYYSDVEEVLEQVYLQFGLPWGGFEADALALKNRPPTLDNDIVRSSVLTAAQEVIRL